ncbi:reverse transcriptase/maturase family protein [Halomonas sabkhae]|uniref:reverse transcriptase/maturase family protein n=1 Tax=Halomonas sabkhae TaxID=626223 RepID=UPI0025B3F81F|nr:reverse transcriptase/maturase family protein [Halomonas sabkhae]MDN3524363.1 reverse transcriptase/maturase family protein [Halomonas sabkhae]
MRTHGFLFDRYANFDALHAGYLRARKGCRDSRSCMRFEQRLEENLIDLLNHLHWGSYHTGPYRHFYVHEPKTRRITALTQFRDRVLQQAMYAVLEPIWERRFISDSYACRVGKGTHRAADRAQEMLGECLRKHGQIYVLKADISKYFASIDHGHAKRLIRRAIKCPRTLALLDEMIDSYHEPGLLGQGMPIGNLISQLLANVYLDALDQYVKCRLGEPWYIRYMDDWLIISPDKKRLHKLRIHLEWWLAETLSLETNHKTCVFPVHPRRGRGLDFVGYHMWPHHRRLRKGSMKRFKRRVRRLRRDYATGEVGSRDVTLQLNSWLAHASHANAEGFVRSVIYDQPWEMHHAPLCD